ncbi:MAG: TolB family protein, partial [Desulfonatronovibrionaceae bacterium]
NSLEASRPARYSMGLFAAVSPQGDQVAATISETSVFVMMNDIYFSQLFFPATGEIALFDADTGTMARLDGASRKDMIQTAPAWSQDGKTLAFSRAQVNPELVQKVVDRRVVNEPATQKIYELNKKYPVQFDIYTLELEEQNLEAVPLKGASNNGSSNYFPRYSPDGKWIVFTRSPTGLVLQPDSRLFIVPARGGRARELAANQPVMNSWHSWSPDSRWLVFTSKARSAFTELYLTHIDEQGKSSPAIRLFRLSSNDMAAMVPEFVPAGALISEQISFGPGAVGESMAVDGR